MPRWRRRRIARLRRKGKNANGYTYHGAFQSKDEYQRWLVGNHSSKPLELLTLEEYTRILERLA